MTPKTAKNFSEFHVECRIETIYSSDFWFIRLFQWRCQISNNKTFNTFFWSRFFTPLVAKLSKLTASYIFFFWFLCRLFVVKYTYNSDLVSWNFLEIYETLFVIVCSVLSSTQQELRFMVLWTKKNPIFRRIVCDNNECLHDYLLDC